jgi:mannitol-specific phosphotransferase system IIBC component
VKKTRTLWWLLGLLFLVVFNLVFFVTGGTEHNASVWISYGFIHFSYFMVLLFPRLIRKSRSASVFGYAIGTIGIGYFILELIIGISFMLAAPENWRIALIVQIIIAFIYAFLLLSHMIANERTAENEARSQTEIQYMKTAASDVSSIMSNTTDAVLKKRIEKVFEAIKYSPTRSHSLVSDIEKDIVEGIDSLRSSVAADDKATSDKQVDSLLRLVSERNRKLQTLN